MKNRLALAAVAALASLAATVVVVSTAVPGADAFDGEQPLNPKIKADAVLSPGQ